MVHFDYQFVLEDKYIYVTKEGCKYTITSPYLKVLKAKHEFKNKYYLIVQLDQDLDIDEKVEDFIKEVRHMDEYSKEMLMTHSKSWYGKKWDIYTLDSMTRYPIDEQKGIFYMKVIIDKEDKEVHRQIQTLEKLVENQGEVYISFDTYFKGLRWSREVFTEEWYLKDFRILEEEKDSFQEMMESLLSKDKVEKKRVEKEDIKEVEEVEVKEVEVKEEEVKEEEVKEEEVKEEVREVKEEVREVKVEEIREEEVKEEEIRIKRENESSQCLFYQPFIQLNEGLDKNIQLNEHLVPFEEVKEIKKKIEKKSKDEISVSSKKIKKVFTLHGRVLK
jgi:hypothetical protein